MTGLLSVAVVASTFVLSQVVIMTEEDESILGPFDVVFVTMLWSSLSPCKLICVCVWVVWLYRLQRLRLHL